MANIKSHNSVTVFAIYTTWDLLTSDGCHNPKNKATDLVAFVVCGHYLDRA